ncbi:MAG: alkaline phosphatase family protein [Bacteroidales bacterium]
MNSGPDAEQTREKVEMLDGIVGQLMEGIRNLEFSDKVNLIVLSDHGMGPTSPERYVNLLDHVGEG